MSEEKDGCGTAFPIVHPDGMGVQYWGLTIRDYFAAQFLAGRAAVPGRVDPAYDAKFAYEVADAMITERNK